MISRLFNALYANAYLLLALTALFWAGNAVVGRGVHEDMPPMALAWWRLVVSLLILLPFAWRNLTNDWQTIRQQWKWLAFLGITGAGFFNIGFYFGLHYTEALNALVIQTSGPVLILIATATLFGDRITRHQASGVLIALVGVLIMIARGDPTTLTSISFNIGDLGVVAAMVSWAVYTAFLRKQPAIADLSFVATTFIAALLFTTPFYAVEHLSGWQFEPTWETLLAVLYVAIFPSILAYAFYNRGVQLIGADRAGICLYLVPSFGAVMAIAFLGETPHLYHAIGIALILTGITLAARKR